MLAANCRGDANPSPALGRRASSLFDAQPLSPSSRGAMKDAIKLHDTGRESQDCNLDSPERRHLVYSGAVCMTKARERVPCTPLV